MNIDLPTGRLISKIYSRPLISLTFKQQKKQFDQWLFIGAFTLCNLSRNEFVFRNWSCMIRDVTRCNLSCNLSRNLSGGWDLFLSWSAEILRDKLQERCYTVQWLEDALQRCGNRCEKV